MYEANGVTAEFPLLPLTPEGDTPDGSVVVLVSPTGSAVTVSEESYTVRDGAVYFNVPPPEGWIVGFDSDLLAGPGARPLVCTVVYPDGTLKQLDKDPWELLAEAKTERDEAKKLLRDAQNAIEKTERVIHVESEVAKEKLSARLEKYGSLVEDSIRQAANGTRDELQDWLSRQIEEVRAKHDETMKAREDAYRAARAAADMAEKAAASTEERVKTELQTTTKQAIEAYERTRAMHSEILDFRDQAQSAAATTGAKLQEAMALTMNAMLEQARSLRATVEHELQTALSKENTEISGLVSEVKTARDATQAAAVRILEIERHCAEIDQAQHIREEGMKATWNRIAGFKKTFDHRVLQMRGTAVAETGEGEE
jgi:hypothetical protein